MKEVATLLLLKILAASFLLAFPAVFIGCPAPRPTYEHQACPTCYGEGKVESEQKDRWVVCSRCKNGLITTYKEDPEPGD